MVIPSRMANHEFNKAPHCLKIGDVLHIQLFQEIRTGFFFTETEVIPSSDSTFKKVVQTKKVATPEVLILTDPHRYSESGGLCLTKRASGDDRGANHPS